MGSLLKRQTPIRQRPVTAVRNRGQLIIPNRAALRAQRNLFENGGFDTDTVWGKDANWAILEGAADANGAAGNLTQTGILEPSIGDKYELTYQILQTNEGGDFTVRLGDDVNDNLVFNTVGVHVVSVLSSGAGQQFIFRAAAGLILKLDNVLLFATG